MLKRRFQKIHFTMSQPEKATTSHEEGEVDLDAYGYHDAEITLDQLRSQHFTRLQDMVYLDHAGTTLPSEVYLAHALQLISTTVLGNPHSQSASSKLSEQYIEQARRCVLSWLHADAKEYSVIFTAGSTASLKLVAESFSFTSQSILRQTVSNHTSCVGMRELALRQGATVHVMDNEDQALLGVLEPSTDDPSPPSSEEETPLHLFVYPGESNYSGRKFPLEWVHKYHHQPPTPGRWYVLLDATAYVATNPLSLAEFPFDFVSFSFHKIFGFPTGLGALVVRNESAQVLRKGYFGGGTVESLIATERTPRFRKDISARYEDGTVPFSSIAVLPRGFELFQQLGGMERISAHCFTLTQWLYRQLKQLTHYNGQPVCSIYGRHHLADPRQQGAILAMTVRRASGVPVGYSEVEKLATLHNIHLRAGCFCNAGECHEHLALTPEQVHHHASLGHVCWDDHDLIDGKPTGSIRISLGYMTTLQEVQRMVDLMKKYFVEGEPSSTHGGEKAKHEVCAIAGVYLYPIKSCGAVSVDQWVFGKRGLAFDREWAVIDRVTGRALSAKNHPQMLSIHPTLDLTQQLLHVKAPSVRPLCIPWESTQQESVAMRVCGDSCEASVYGQEVDDWFSQVIGTECRLVRKSQTQVRTCKVDAIHKAEQTRLQVTGGTLPVPTEPTQTTEFSFANESQLLVMNEASVIDLHARVQATHGIEQFAESVSITVSRFRANILVRGPGAYEEDDWQALVWSPKEGEGKSVVFPCLGPCVRCRMITYSPVDGAKEEHGEPLATLAEYRRYQGRVMFGRHAGCQLTTPDQEITLKVGQELYPQ